MTMSRPHRWVTVAVPGILVIGALAAQAPAGAAPASTAKTKAKAPYATVVDHLRNPRGLAIEDGRLYVAEAGQAGDVCFQGATTEEGGPTCAGFSSRISRVDVRRHRRTDVVTGLVSVGGPLFAIGATGVALDDGRVTGLMGLNGISLPPAEACGGGPDCVAVLAAATQQLGHIFSAKRHHAAVMRRDVGGFDYQWTVDNKATIGLGDPSYQPSWAHDPDFMPGDANPYGMARGRHGTYVVDGGANTLTWVPDRGAMRVVAALPDPPAGGDHPYDAVATCVAPTKRGVVVGDLNGRLFLVKGSSITVAPLATTSKDGAFLVAAGGCASDGEGHVFITDIFAGSIVKLTLSTMRLSWVRPPGTLNFPAGIVAGEDDALFVSNNSVCPDFVTPVDPQNPCGGVTGSIVRLRA